MGLYDIDENEFVEDENPYLSDPAKSLSLMAEILPHNNQWSFEERQARDLDKILDYELPNTLDVLHSADTLAYIKKLRQLSDQLMEYRKVRLLRGRNIIGIGGSFSAGKSAFINSLLQEGTKINLPEDQTATTSIATYVMDGNHDELLACKQAGDNVTLSIEAMEALTHEFYRKYQIGFARFIQNLVVITPAFPEFLASRVAILDTPGYSKPDIDTQKSLTDEEVARKHLRSVDFLIWLIDIGKGTIKDSDLKFLQTLDKDLPILIIFNKADKRPEEDIRDIVSKAKKLLSQFGIKVFGVTAYSSLNNGCEFLGLDYVRTFLEKAGNEAKHKQDVGDEIKAIFNEIDEMFTREKQQSQEDQYALSDSISKSEDILAIRSLVSRYRHVSLEMRKLQNKEKDFQKLRHAVEQGVKILLDIKKN